MNEFLDLKSIEGRFSPHDNFLRTQLDRRKVCFPFADDPRKMADFIGGHVEKPKSGEKWCIRKEFFPGVSIHIVFRSDDEFGDALEAFFSGEKVRSMPGEDLAELSITLTNHMIRYIRSVVPEKQLPEICSRI